MLVAGPISGALGGRFGSKLPLSLGAGMTATGLLGLGLDHGTQLAVIAWAFVMSGGIGLAFAAMANLVVEAVPPAQTGEASGFNTLTRSVGASLGSQVTAAILAGSAVAESPLATDGGFTAAFLVSAGVAGVAAVIALMIPRGEHQAVRPRAPRSEPALAER
jgi:MFS family permease